MPNKEGFNMSVLTDLIYGGSHAVAGLTEGAVNDAIAKYGAEKEIAFPDTAYFFPTIYAATGVKVKTLGDLTACVGVLKSLITDQEDLTQALNGRSRHRRGRGDSRRPQVCRRRRALCQ